MHAITVERSRVRPIIFHLHIDYIYISSYSVSCSVYYILLVFYLYSYCNSVRMSHYNKRLLTLFDAKPDD